MLAKACMHRVLLDALWTASGSDGLGCDMNRPVRRFFSRVRCVRGRCDGGNESAIFERDELARQTIRSLTPA